MNDEKPTVSFDNDHKELMWLRDQYTGLWAFIESQDLEKEAEEYLKQNRDEIEKYL